MMHEARHRLWLLFVAGGITALPLVFANRAIAQACGESEDQVPTIGTFGVATLVVGFAVVGSVTVHKWVGAAQAGPRTSGGLASESIREKIKHIGPLGVLVALLLTTISVVLPTQTRAAPAPLLKELEARFDSARAGMGTLLRNTELQKAMVQSSHVRETLRLLREGSPRSELTALRRAVDTPRMADLSSQTVTDIESYASSPEFRALLTSFNALFSDHEFVSRLRTGTLSTDEQRLLFGDNTLSTSGSINSISGFFQWLGDEAAWGGRLVVRGAVAVVAVGVVVAAAVLTTAACPAAAPAAALVVEAAATGAAIAVAIATVNDPMPTLPPPSP